jgi:hypothetical protein
MARFWAVLMVGIAICCGVAHGQVVHVPNSVNMCPVTHGCRTVSHGVQPRHAATTVTAGPVQCPPGTYQLPNTNKCRVR